MWRGQTCLYGLPTEIRPLQAQEESEWRTGLIGSERALVCTEAQRPSRTLVRSASAV